MGGERVSSPPPGVQKSANYHSAISGICYFVIFKKISDINTSVIWGLVSNNTPCHRKQSRIDMEDRSNILSENPDFNAKCLNSV